MPPTPSAPLLPRAFYDRTPEIVAPELLGKILIHHHHGQRLAGRILETEAYLGGLDPASHASRGKSASNAVLFGPPGYSYVYLIYGLHYCVNVSCLSDGQPGGVLFRALAPVEGIDIMARLRHVAPGTSAKVLAGGPGRLCEALGITRANCNNLDVTSPSSPIQIADDGYRPAHILTTTRIGIRKAVDLPLRFLIDEKHA